MYPRCWLPRRSWRLEHNQCRSLYYFPARLIALFTFIIRTIAQGGCRGVPFVATPLFNRNCGYAFESLRNGPILHGVDQFAPAQEQHLFCKIAVRWV